jgi:hypothetical protein
MPAAKKKTRKPKRVEGTPREHRAIDAREAREEIKRKARRPDVA